MEILHVVNLYYNIYMLFRFWTRFISGDLKKNRV